MTTRTLVFTSALLAAGLSLRFAAGAHAAEPEDSTAAGRVALARQDFAVARRHFETALDAARRAGDAARLPDALFFLGLTAQQSAATAAPPAAALASARGYYTEAIAARPAFPAAWNNLAEVYLAEKNRPAAAEALQRAMAAGGSKEGIYAQKYADLQLQDGKWRDACNHYARAARLQPDDEALRSRLVELCLKFDPPTLLGYLWMLATQGQELPVQQIVVSLLPRPEWSSEHQDDLMAILAVCLSRQNYAPAEFPRTEGAALLAAQSGRPAIRELLELHRGERLTPSAYPWWKDRSNPEAAPTRVGLWPQEAFRQLACALGARWRTVAGGEEKAIAYYRLAAFLDPREPDPEALTRLAELYGNAQRLPELIDFMGRYEGEILAAKNEAYRAAKRDKVYRFHATLGVIYSKLEIWGDERTPASAIFQLQQAARIAQRAAQLRPPNPPPGLPGTPASVAGRPEIRPEPQLVNLLAEAYGRTHRPVQAFELKVDQGQEFLRAGDVAAAREVLRDADRWAPAAVSSPWKAALEQLQRDLPNLHAPRKSALR